MPFEAANSLRSSWLRGTMSMPELEEAHRELDSFRVQYWPYRARLAQRSWELIDNLTIYDAAYVALAELLEAPLLTLDRRLTGAPGIRCEVVAYEGA